MCVIYQLTSPSGKSYIGQTKNLSTRLKQHQTSPECRLFHYAIKKYGWNSMVLTILKENLSLDEANYWEEYYINTYNTLTPNGYNLIPGGNNHAHTDETKQLLREIKLNNPRTSQAIFNVVQANKKRKGIPNHKNRGRTLSDEAKQRISQANSGRIQSEEERKRRGRPQLKTRKPVSVNGIIYSSKMEVCKVFHINSQILKKRLNSPDWDWFEIISDCGVHPNLPN